MDLMLNKEEIEKAVKQLKTIEKKYPEFHRMFLMIMELQNSLDGLQKAAEKKTFIQKLREVFLNGNRN